jgi:hypothetical protein
MNFRSRIYKPALLMLAVVLFCVVGQMQARLNVDRKTMGLTKMDPLQNAPPVLAFTTVALGGFRGLIANALWMRLNDLQLDDKYFEMVQLADWITKLQPHMVAVWQFQAWNMAYNISVKFKDHEDRWHWVKRGVELLRDDGLKYNPNETRLYRDLSWLFQHKIGANLDDAHMLYKLRWAQEMQNVLGGRPNFAELMNPTTPEWKERARKLRDVYKMDPKIVQEVDQEYGPFDWRLPDGQAVYWAELGRRNARPEDQETLRRSIYQSLQQMGFRGGALDPSVTNVTEKNFMLWPNLAQIPTISAAYEKMIKEEVGNPHGLQQNMETAHKNFLKQAIVLLYVDGRERQATQWYNYLTKIYTNAFIAEGNEGKSVEDYAISQITEANSETDQVKTTADLMGLFDREILCLARDNDDEAQNYRNLAQKVYNHYTKKIGVANHARVGLEKITTIRKRVIDKDLDPKFGFPPEVRAELRVKLDLPPETVPAPTNAPSGRPS